MPCFRYLIVLSLLVAVCSSSMAKERETSTGFKQGAQCLFIGHSFFVPVAKSFDRIAARNGFDESRVDFVFAGGSSGAPGALWNNARRQKLIEDKLATGKVELLGMTTAMTKSSFEDYQQWIDLALKHNPKTQFFIGLCWAPGGPRVDANRYNKMIEAGHARFSKTATQLREAYPKSQIHFINYGKVAAVMKHKFDAGELDDIDQMVGRDRNALFRDGGIGHGGPMMLEASALTWLAVLYDAEIENLKQVSFDSDDLIEVASQVLEFNRKLDSDG